ncbi:MAG TPA: signal peptidase II [Alphaproteobacteria bacterium]|nr:signal peptidase II [Alphaproteobacteria bacterium]HNS43815.1 signal peptidase II [Alphaproteobacteria bacterium]
MPRLIAFFLIPVFVLLDQISKWWVIEMFFRPRVFEADGASQPFFTWLTTLGQDQFPPTRLEWFDILNLVMVWNKGISFGIFASDEAMTRIFLIGSSSALVIVLLVWLLRGPTLKVALPLSMIIAGAMGNIWDRVRFGGVADFIDFHIGDWHYPAFNVADSCIVLGVAWLAFDGIILEARRLKKSKEEHKGQSNG